MALGLRPSEWLPVVTTIALFLLVVLATDAVVSRTWADLVGLFYLAASPFLYGYLRTAVPETLPWSVPTSVRSLSSG